MSSRKQPNSTPSASTSTSKDKSTFTKTLLSRAHDSDAADRLFTEKIQHRTFHLRPTSPPPHANARAQRRHERRKKLTDRKRVKPKPLSARQRRGMGLYDVPPESQKYAHFEPLHKLWLGYMHEILGKDVYIGGPGVAAKLASADFHGALVEVSRSGCPSRVGLKGIVVKDAKHVFEIITTRNKLKIVPKEGTLFRVEIPAPENVDVAQEEKTKDAGKGEQGQQGTQTQPAEEVKRNKLVFEILGEQFQTRSSERANKKYKTHFLKDI